MYGEQFLSGINWRDTGRPIRFFFLDARALFGLLIWAGHMTWETFVVAIISVLLFIFFEFLGLTPIVALRTLKTHMISRNRSLENIYTQNWRAQC